MKTFVIGDIHGALRALKQVFERANFNYEKDRLIVLGDVADGWPDVAECFEELLKVKNLIYILGNHDKWLLDWMKMGKRPDIWLYQGGFATVKSYTNNYELLNKHRKFLDKVPFYYIEDGILFVHGGIDEDTIENRETGEMMWNRELWIDRGRLNSKHYKYIHKYKEIYVGHTSIWNYSHKPLKYENVWFMDTGAGWEGNLSMIDIKTKEIFQSDRVLELYPEVRGRF